MYSCPVCKTNTIYVPACRKCISAKFPVLVANSKIHEYGLFAARNIVVNELVIPYAGDIMDVQTVCKRCPHGGDLLVACPELGVYINGQYANGCRSIGSFANHSDTPNCQLTYVDVVDQLDFSDDMHPFWIRATRHIEKGSELTFDYGPRYKWE